MLYTVVNTLYIINFNFSKLFEENDINKPILQIREVRYWKFK